AKGPDEAAFTAEEAEALLDDPRAQLVYGDRTVSIVAPSMLKVQRQQHVDLLKLYLKPEFLTRAAAFAKEHEALLAQVEKKHGVDREVIVAILMFETRLGTITGDYRSFNAFTSQAYFIDEANAVALSGKRGEEERRLLDEEKQRARVERIRERARRNLVVLLRMSKARNMDPLEVKGSWAGALGFPQFMPASLRWAEDGDGDGKVDLFTFPDSFASVARYLSSHGFRKDREKAVWAYNHEAAYVSGVLGFADALKKELAGAAAAPAAAPSAPSP
ncbi:MAG: lytic murein transglycosylase, partial [Myxococcales bacterium]